MTEDIYWYNDEQPKKQSSSPPNCADGIYPCCITNNTRIKFIAGCSQPLGENSCNDCLWMCLPLTLVMDTVLIIPETICYIYNKCKK